MKCDIIIILTQAFDKKSKNNRTPFGLVCDCFAFN